MPYQGGCSQFLISSKGFDSSICDWKNKFSLFGKYHLFRIESFRVVFPMRPSFPTPQGLRSVRHPSKFTPRIRGTIQVRLSFHIDGFLAGPSKVQGDTQPIEPNGMIGPLNGCPKRLSYGVFPSDDKSVTFRR